MANLWYIATDNYGDFGETSLNALWVEKWDGSTSGPAGFETIYNYSLPLELASWIEPDIVAYSRDGIHLIALHLDADRSPDVRVFNKNELYSQSNPQPIADQWYDIPRGGRWAIIDQQHNIHIFHCMGTGPYKLYDTISSDYGLTWNHVLVSDYEYPEKFPDYTELYVSIDSSGNLYLMAARLSSTVGTGGFRLHKSSNNGSTWSLMDYDDELACSLFSIMNDKFFRVIVDMESPYSIKIQKTDDPTDWSDSTVLELTGAPAYDHGYYYGSAFLYDGSKYYYAQGQSAGSSKTETDVYSSTDGDSWSLAGTADYGFSPIWLTYDSDGRLYLFDYYSEYNGGEPNYYRYITFYYSDDQGATWTRINTPFCDDTYWNCDPEYKHWWSCSGALLIPTEGDGIVAIASDGHVGVGFIEDIPSRDTYSGTTGNENESPGDIGVGFIGTSGYSSTISGIGVGFLG
jgi:hypothetical protein